ncbi:MAG TPA: branched-chain amino acid ABC transporter permease [Acholeplasma sp.]|jgi:branched-chain amino acid transport system permease protein
MSSAVISILLNALVTFSFLSLATFGIVLIFKTSSTTNFAQGMIGILGAFTTSYIIDQQGIFEYTGLPSVPLPGPFELILPMLAGILVSFLTGFLIEMVIFRNARYTNPVTKQIITMGLVIIITGLVPMIFNGGIRRASFPFTQDTIMVLGVALPVHNLVTLLIAGIIMVVIFISLKYTKWGLAVRSVASNEKVASLMGINTNLINAMSWAIAGALGALSAITYTAAIGNLSLFSMVDIQVNSFYASILGGFQTFYGPLAGTFILSAGQQVIRMILINFNLAGWTNTVVYLAIMIAILIKPVGLFGKKIMKKV